MSKKLDRDGPETPCPDALLQMRLDVEAIARRAGSPLVFNSTNLSEEALKNALNDLGYGGYWNSIRAHACARFPLRIRKSPPGSWRPKAARLTKHARSSSSKPTK
jgi:hypothetical protein